AGILNWLAVSLFFAEPPHGIELLEREAQWVDACVAIGASRIALVRLQPFEYRHPAEQLIVSRNRARVRWRRWRWRPEHTPEHPITALDRLVRSGADVAVKTAPSRRRPPR